MMQYFDVTYLDLWADPNGGWVGEFVARRELSMPDDATDRKIERAARAMFDFTGRRTIKDDDGCITRWVDPRNAVAVELSWGH